ncbi:MAG: hypothetical protein V4564_13965 [Pseudomonadota bacterium]|uniref:hypothetical protein n=1 Tax=Sphingomonas sp. ERG5 TaxID=1381597 RepID=UPI00068FB108|nr:hypothetical protein [Sphingomonas sp. ERG5]
MIFRAAIIALTCAALAACNGSTAPAGNTMAAAKDTAPDPMEAKIAALSEPLRQVTFFRAINDADYTCQRIVNVVPRGRIEGKLVWAVECEQGAQYVIELQRGGIFHVSGVPKSARP